MINKFYSEITQYLLSLTEQEFVRNLANLILISQSPDKCCCCVYHYKECKNSDCYTGITAFIRQVKSDVKLERESLK